MTYAENVISFRSWWSTLDDPLWALLDLDGKPITPWLRRNEQYTVPTGQFMVGALGIRSKSRPDQSFEQTPRMVYAGHVLRLDLDAD